MELGDGSLRSESQVDQQVDSIPGSDSRINGSEMGINGELGYLGRAHDESLEKMANLDGSMSRNGVVNEMLSFHAGDVKLDIGEGRSKENGEVWSNGLKACESENSKVYSPVKNDVVEKLDGSVGAEIRLNGPCFDEKRAETSLEGTESPLKNLEVAGGRSDNGDFQLSTKVDEKESHFDEVKVGVSGSSASETVIPGPLGCDSFENSNSKSNDAERLSESPSNKNSLGASGETSVKKGYGLKKWRRIKRDATKDGVSGVDLNRMLKRGLSAAGEIVKNRGSSSENQQKNERSAASMFPLLGNAGFSSSPLGILDLESATAIVSSFTAGTDSDNSEDRSGRFLAARNKVKLKQEVLTIMGNSKDKSKLKNSTVKVHGNSAPKGHQEKGKAEISKKLREERVTVEKENSYSSVESDLRSVNSVMYGSVENNNGRLRERHVNYQENDLTRSPGRQSDEGIQTDYLKQHEQGVNFVGVLGARSIRDVRKSESKNDRPHVDEDPLVQSVVLLRAAEAALEKEIQILRDIGKETCAQLDGHDCSLSGDDTNISTKAQELNSSGQLHFEEMEGSSSPPIDTQIAELVQQISLLEHLLEEKEEILKAKEANSKKQSPREGSEYQMESPNEIGKAMETELEELFMKRMEAEIEYMTITKMTEKLKVAVEDQSRLFEEQKSLAVEQAWMLHKLQDAECKATILKHEAEKVEASTRDLLNAEEVLKMQNKVCKFSLLCFFQAVLLCVAVVWFLQLYPESIEIVPT